MIRPPPISTLFPYTTLFRSLREPSLRHARRFRSDIAARARAARPGGRPEARLEHGDRKSTRLNSSHRTISYAVFCLKKKKKEQSAVLTSSRALVTNSRLHDR